MRGWPGVVFVVLMLGEACIPRLPEGHFACTEGEPGACPAGFACQVRAGDEGPRCHAAATTTVCGDGVVDPGEDCDGAAPTTCSALGYWRGTARCSAGCRLDASGCVPLVTASLGLAEGCAVDAGGVGWCWGNGQSARNGDRLLLSHVEPRSLPVSEALVDVQVGGLHACALAASGSVRCWGDNQFGIIGSGAPLDLVTLPWAVSSPVRFQQLSVGWAHTCGLDADGQIWCWGYNGFGELGDGSFARQDAPTRVASPIRFVEVAAAGNVSCGLDDAGQAWCWGQNSTGQLGDGRTDHASCSGHDCSPEPVAVAGGHRFTSLAGSSHLHLCGLDDAGQAWCWGRNGAGQVGDGTTEDRWVPTAVTGDHRFVQVSAGFGRTTAIDEAGEAWSWGQGSPGDGTVDGGPVPVRAAAGGPFVAATAGRAASCGLTGAGGLACWGFDGGGHLGAPGAGAIPRRVETDVPLTALSAGQAHTCGLDASGRAHCWGSNATDQLGNPGLDGLAPGPVLGDRAFVAIEAGGQLTAAIDLEGQAWFWGLVFTADPGTSVQASSPERLDLPGEPVALAAGFQHLCGLDASGLASCWGNNLAGQLGTDGAWGADGPLPVLGDHRFAALAAGGWHTCGLDLDGGAWCWGSGVYGQVGDGALTDRRVPVAVDTDQRFGHLACGGFHCCGLVASGTSFCWGLNTHGQLGSGEASLLAGTPRETRGEVPFGTLVAGDAYTCALDLDGGAWCWGGDAYGYPVPGPLGAGSGYVPTRLETDLRFVALHAGDHHVCGVDLLGEAQCWGANPAGQLGIDDWLRVPAPFPGPEAP